MIKINLAKAVKLAEYKAADSGAMSSLDSSNIETLNQSELLQLALKKLGLMLIVPALMFGYEKYSLPKKIAERDVKQKQFDEYAQTNLKAKAAAEDMKKLEKESIRIAGKIDIVDGIRRTQLLEVKVLDTIQRLIPARVWLISLEISGGKVALSGNAGSDQDLTIFMDSLSRSQSLKDVNLVRSVEQIDSTTGLPIKKFDINASMEQKK